MNPATAIFRLRRLGGGGDDDRDGCQAKMRRNKVPPAPTTLSPDNDSSGLNLLMSSSVERPPHKSLWKVTQTPRSKSKKKQKPYIEKPRTAMAETVKRRNSIQQSLNNYDSDETDYIPSLTAATPNLRDSSRTTTSHSSSISTISSSNNNSVGQLPSPYSKPSSSLTPPTSSSSTSYASRIPPRRTKSLDGDRIARGNSVAVTTRSVGSILKKSTGNETDVIHTSCLVLSNKTQMTPQTKSKTKLGIACAVDIPSPWTQADEDSEEDHDRFSLGTPKRILRDNKMHRYSPSPNDYFSTPRPSKEGNHVRRISNNNEDVLFTPDNIHRTIEEQRELAKEMAEQLSSLPETPKTASQRVKESWVAAEREHANTISHRRSPLSRSGHYHPAAGSDHRHHRYNDSQSDHESNSGRGRRTVHRTGSFSPSSLSQQQHSEHSRGSPRRNHSYSNEHNYSINKTLSSRNGRTRSHSYDKSTSPSMNSRRNNYHDHHDQRQLGPHVSLLQRQSSQKSVRSRSQRYRPRSQSPSHLVRQSSRSRRRSCSQTRPAAEDYSECESPCMRHTQSSSKVSPRSSNHNLENRIRMRGKRPNPKDSTSRSSTNQKQPNPASTNDQCSFHGSTQPINLKDRKSVSSSSSLSSLHSAAARMALPCSLKQHALAKSHNTNELSHSSGESDGGSVASIDLKDLIAPAAARKSTLSSTTSPSQLVAGGGSRNSFHESSIDLDHVLNHMEVLHHLEKLSNLKTREQLERYRDRRLQAREHLLLLMEGKMTVSDFRKMYHLSDEDATNLTNHVKLCLEMNEEIRWDLVFHILLSLEHMVPQHAN